MFSILEVFKVVFAVYLNALVDLFSSSIGINDQGLYRVVGVSSKVQRLLSLLIGMPLFYNYFYHVFILIHG